MPFLTVSFDLGALSAQAAEAACFAAGAMSVTLSDAHDDAVLEPAPGEVRLWPATRMQALFAAEIEAHREKGHGGTRSVARRAHRSPSRRSR